MEIYFGGLMLAAILIYWQALLQCQRKRCWFDRIVNHMRRILSHSCHLNAYIVFCFFSTRTSLYHLTSQS